MEPNETCIICLKINKQNDLMIILGCGHYYHYFCSLKIHDKYNCPICREQIRSSARFIWKEPLNIFDDNFNFKLLFFETKYNYNIIDKTIKTYFSNKITNNYKNTIYKFIDKNLRLFYTKILHSCNKNINKTILCSFDYNHKINDIPITLLIYGSYPDGTMYFKHNNILTLVEYIQSKFTIIFNVYTYRYNNQHHIAIKW